MQMSSIKNVGVTCLVLGVGGNFAPTLSLVALHWGEGLSWALDLLTHWQLIWMFLTVLGVALCMDTATRARKVLLGVAGCAGLAVAGFSIQPGSLTRVAPAELQPQDLTIKVASANLLYGSADLKVLRAWLNDIQADLVVLQEVTPLAAAHLAAWSEFQVKVMTPQDDGFGMAVFSRKEAAHVSWGVSYGSPFAVVKTQRGSVPFTFFGIHPPPPAKPSWHGLRNSLMEHLVEEAELGSSIVAGDFNATPWSAGMPRRALFRATSLMPTWLGVLPIDQIMATSDWSVLDEGRGPDIGSDHRPVWAQLTLKANVGSGG